MFNLKNKDLTILLASLLLTLATFIYGVGTPTSQPGVLIRAPFLYGKQLDEFQKYVQL